MTFGKITKSQFDAMQFGVGVLVRFFDVEQPEIEDKDILCATTGGISLNIVAEYEDLSEEIYMMTPGTMEMLLMTGWQVDAEFTTVTESAGMFKFMLGAVDENNGIKPRYEVKQSDFGDIWWIGDRLDDGFVAIKFCNALSDEGISLTATKRGKGTVDVHITAHGTLEGDMDAVPVEMYSIAGHPRFYVHDHLSLIGYNLGNDVISLDEETGELTITENGEWHYYLNEETGIMEVSRD